MRCSRFASLAACASLVISSSVAAGPPTEADARIRRAIQLYDGAQFYRALSVLERALAASDLTPEDHLTGLVYSARIYAVTEQHDAAVHAFGQALRLAPDYRVGVEESPFIKAAFAAALAAAPAPGPAPPAATTTGPATTGATTTGATTTGAATGGATTTGATTTGATTTGATATGATATGATTTGATTPTAPWPAQGAVAEAAAVTDSPDPAAVAAAEEPTAVPAWVWVLVSVGLAGAAAAATVGAIVVTQPTYDAVWPSP